MESRKPAVLLLLFAAVLPLGHGFRLLPTPIETAKAGAIGSSGGLKAASFSVKAATYFNKFYRGPTVLSVQVIGSAETCSDLCTADTRCEVWTWCPLNITQGCEVLNFGDLATTTTTTTITTSGIMAYGTCILSCSMRPGAKEYIFMEGPRVEWSGGISNSSVPLSPLPPASPQPAPSPAPSPQPIPSPAASPEPVPSPVPAPQPPVASPSPIPANSPAPLPSPVLPSPPPAVPQCPADGCPCHEVPAFTLSEGHTTINWPIGITLGGSNPECYDVKTGDFVRSPATFKACKTPSSNLSDAAVALAKSFCNGTTEEASLEFATVVQQGGPAAEDAVAALLHAQTELACFQGSTILSVMSPPMSLVQDRDFNKTIANILAYFTNVANASERAGMGVCTVIYSTKGDVTDLASAEVLATIHTGTSA